MLAWCRTSAFALFKYIDGVFHPTDGSWHILYTICHCVIATTNWTHTPKWQKRREEKNRHKKLNALTGKCEQWHIAIQVIFKHHFLSIFFSFFALIHFFQYPWVTLLPYPLPLFLLCIRFFSLLRDKKYFTCLYTLQLSFSPFIFSFPLPFTVESGPK